MLVVAIFSCLCQLSRKALHKLVFDHLVANGLITLAISQQKTAPEGAVSTNVLTNYFAADDYGVGVRTTLRTSNEASSPTPSITNGLMTLAALPIPDGSMLLRRSSKSLSKIE